MRQAADALQHDVLRRARSCSEALLKLYGFREGDAAEAPLPLLHGRWEMDLFSPDTLRQAGARLGAGAAAGAAVGLVADIALAGVSLGAGMAVGGAVGSALAHGWGPLGRRMANRLRGVREVTAEDAVLVVLATRQLALLQALERRGHAEVLSITGEDLELDDAAGRSAQPEPTSLHQHKLIEQAVRDTRPARSHPQWETRRFGDGNLDMGERVEAIAQILSASRT